MPQVEVVQVGQKLGKAVELRYQLFNIASVEDGFPGSGDRVELAVGAIEFPALEANVEAGEGFHPHQVIQNAAWVWIVSEVVGALR